MIHLIHWWIKLYGMYQVKPEMIQIHNRGCWLEEIVWSMHAVIMLFMHWIHRIKPLNSVHEIVYKITNIKTPNSSKLKHSFMHRCPAITNSTRKLSWSFILELLATPKLIKILKAELEASTVPAYTCGHASILASSAKQKSNVRV